MLQRLMTEEGYSWRASVGDNYLYRSRDTPIPSLNTIPLIDVMKVLLVMFLITARLQTNAGKVAPPEATLPQLRSNLNTLSVAPSGDIGWNGVPVDLLMLRRYLDKTRTMTPEPELPIAADPLTRYARVDETLAVVQRSRVGKGGFVDNERYAPCDKQIGRFCLYQLPALLAARTAAAATDERQACAKRHLPLRRSLGRPPVSSGRPPKT
jgi:biopolymer transport protein ExbD